LIAEETTLLATQMGKKDGNNQWLHWLPLGWSSSDVIMNFTPPCQINVKLPAHRAGVAEHDPAKFQNGKMAEFNRAL
jgi:hypothetical protein